MQDIIAYDNIMTNLQNVRDYTNTMNYQWSNINNNFSNIDNSFKNINNSVNQAKIDEGYEYKVIGMPFLNDSNYYRPYILQSNNQKVFITNDTTTTYILDSFVAPYNGSMQVSLSGTSNGGSTSLTAAVGSVKYWIDEKNGIYLDYYFFDNHTVNSHKAVISGYFEVTKGKTYELKATYSISSRYQSNNAWIPANSIYWTGQVIKCHSNTNKIFLQK